MRILDDARALPRLPVPFGVREDAAIERSREENEQETASSSVRMLLMRKVIEAQESERRRIAREIHDETEQLLGNAIFRLDLCLMRKPELGELAGGDLDTIREILVTTVQGLQTLSHSLRPSLLDDLGLEASLAWLFRTSGLNERLNLRWKASGLNVRLPSPIETALFRIVQEACSNILKHAQAKNVRVCVRINRRRAIAIIIDDGVGFDAKGGSSHLCARGNDVPMGLSGMKERAELAGGRLSLRSCPEKGTRIAAVIPLRSRTEEPLK